MRQDLEVQSWSALMTAPFEAFPAFSVSSLEARVVKGVDGVLWSGSDGNGISGIVLASLCDMSYGLQCLVFRASLGGR